MWLFSAGQGNSDPLRLLWSETPLNRSSKQEFKPTLSPPTRAPVLRFRAEAEGLPRCQVCWQHAELKALSNSNDQCHWLAANGLHSPTFWRGGAAPCYTLGQEQFLMWSLQMILFALVFLLRQNASLRYVAPSRFALFRGSESAPPQQLWGVGSKVMSQQRTKERKCD